ncbi:ankyrin repeat domain-containing protein [Paenibacillus ginsengarvi]|uniref:Uncharacterized protein n=1 Tax=Paenibacillus ginsengarvi TaxID=400777 RepID=A0A3B0CHU8_9BACL|nr:ankyrin repeat domain-containing protein [Paenibacillus ginsengarvi]RKN84308.1 hypothetical protein D7M11_15030 [Paenibacillus ginsengarvi]
MIKLKDIGNFETLPDMAMLLYEGNVTALRDALASGWDVNGPMTLSRYTDVYPLELAIMMNRLEVVELLVEHGAELNRKDDPSFLTAVRYGGERVIRYLVERGAKLHLLNQVKSNAYDQAYYGKKENIPLIRELGLDIRKYGGSVLRKAVSDRNRNMVAYLLDQGVDINFNKPDMVYPYQATPLTVAVRAGDLAMVQYLMERGADVTIAERGGERAYTIAVSGQHEQHEQIAVYLKAAEPPLFHDLENKKYELKPFKLSEPLVEFLTGEALRLELRANEYGIAYVQFLSLTDTVPMKAGRQKLLRLSANVDNYSHLVLAWNPKTKRIGCYDEEHQEYADLGDFMAFVAEADKLLIAFMEGEL